MTQTVPKSSCFGMRSERLESPASIILSGKPRTISLARVMASSVELKDVDGDRLGHVRG